jgi:hypothetical protein
MNQMSKCEEGHFYNKELNPSGCPFCGVGPIHLTKKYDEQGDDTVKYENEKDSDKTRKYSAGDAAKPEWHSQAKTDADKTQAVWGPLNPVVGWLVCHKGHNKGRDYRIHAGVNNIGRDTSSQICIVGDDAISRIEHARIFFDRKNSTFHLVAGSGRSGVYCNGQVVLQTTALKAYDDIELGATHLKFVPFCGERFKWDQETPQQETAKPPEGGDGSSRPPDDYSQSSID